jgi:predicted lipoprotein with Yx(FWY)xxD motif
MVSRKVRSLAALGLVALAGAGTGVMAAGHTAQAAPALVKTTSAHILVNARGMALYVYAPDQKNKSVCYGKCAAFWPPVTVGAGVTVPATMPGIGGTFGTTKRTDGNRQLTYDGAPLYTFVKDKDAEDRYGQGLDVAGGYWWLVVVNAAQGSSAGTSGS